MNVLDSVLKWFGEDGFLLLDEVTSVRDWEGWLVRNHELLKGRLRLIVSSSRKSLVLPSRPLRGGILSFELFPLSFSEFLSFKAVVVEKTVAGKGGVERAFAEYLKFGGFPEVVLVADETDKVSILNSYFKDVVGLDVAEASGTEPVLAGSFGKYVLQTTYFSASKCLDFFKSVGRRIGKEKILQLEKYSEYGYSFFFSTIFFRVAKDRAQYPCKAYACDTGFYYALTGRVDLSRLYECAAFLGLRRRMSGRKGLYYWKNKAGLEVDLVVSEGIGVEAVYQVACDLSGEKTAAREKRALEACGLELKPGKMFILTGNAEELESVGGKVRAIPLMEWLLG